MIRCSVIWFFKTIKGFGRTNPSKHFFKAFITWLYPWYDVVISFEITWYFLLCLEVVCHKNESLSNGLFSFLHLDKLSNRLMNILVRLFLSWLEWNGRVHRASVQVSKEGMRQRIPLPLGGPQTPWLWATELCCLCVWSAARCSAGKNKNRKMNIYIYIIYIDVWNT